MKAGGPDAEAPASACVSGAPTAEALGARPCLHVLVGLLVNRRGEVLVNRRRPGTHMAGYWEFPGGKSRPGEERLAALRRELREELGIEVVDARPVLELAHDYPERSVTLDVWRVERFGGEPYAREGQELRWVPVPELATIGLLPADRPIVDFLLG
ncbi:MAG TPA: 8-oxo-dGTP diphosphatase MutT [Gammaproteobacteria bacterium]